MRRPIHIGTGPFGTIFAGHLLKDGRTWAVGKQDVTKDAIAAVIQHIEKSGSDWLTLVTEHANYTLTLKISEREECD